MMWPKYVTLVTTCRTWARKQSEGNMFPVLQWSVGIIITLFRVQSNTYCNLTRPWAVAVCQNYKKTEQVNYQHMSSLLMMLPSWIQLFNVLQRLSMYKLKKTADSILPGWTPLVTKKGVDVFDCLFQLTWSWVECRASTVQKILNTHTSDVLLPLCQCFLYCQFCHSITHPA